MKLKLTTCILIALFYVFGCKEEFLLNNSLYKADLVVDGTLTNEPGPYKIEITESSPVNNYELIPIEQCVVTISDNHGHAEILKEVKPGVYITDQDGIQGKVGNSYMLSIKTPEGKEYVSDFQELKAPVAIQGVQAELENRNTQDYPSGLPGYQFYISTETIDEPDTYLMWKMEETYEYTVDFDLKDIIFGDLRLDTNELIRIPIVNDYKNNYFRCWRSDDINYIYTGKTTGLTISQIVNHPLLFVGTDSKKLTHRYSLLVKQYSINQSAYNYWNSIEKQFTDQNFLVTSQPANIIGNIYNSENPNDLVKGYFTVASVTKSRIFVDKPEVPGFHYDKCTLVTEPDLIDFLIVNESPPFYLVPYDNSFGYALLRFEYCVKCTLAGGENTKPDFWIDK